MYLEQIQIQNLLKQGAQNETILMAGAFMIQKGYLALHIKSHPSIYNTLKVSEIESAIKNIARSLSEAGIQPYYAIEQSKAYDAMKQLQTQNLPILETQRKVHPAQLVPMAGRILIMIPLIHQLLKRSLSEAPIGSTINIQCISTIVRIPPELQEELKNKIKEANGKKSIKIMTILQAQQYGSPQEIMDKITVIEQEQQQLIEQTIAQQIPGQTMQLIQQLEKEKIVKEEAKKKEVAQIMTEQLQTLVSNSKPQQPPNNDNTYSPSRSPFPLTNLEMTNLMMAGNSIFPHK